jgi:D-alanyl-D-alanine dipeptidase
MIDRSIRATLTGAALIGCVGAAAAGEPPQGFVRLADVAPGIVQDMRYASADNFTGAPVPGYKAPQCWLREDAARALAAAQAEAHARGFDLVVYDCYRPRRAVAAFLAWSKRAEDGTTKERYYPGLTKGELFARGYIAEQSSHSTGHAVDLGVRGWDFGTPFDFFGETSWTANAGVSATARKNRAKLVSLMRRHGFANYEREWWHFTFAAATRPPSLDVEIE